MKHYLIHLHKTAGEIEARDVTKRMNYNEDYRKSIRPDIDREDVVFAEGDVSYSHEYSSSGVNLKLIEMIDKVKSKNYNDNDKVTLGIVTEKTAHAIENITGIDVRGFEMVIEARQIHHILNVPGVDGKSDHSMANDNDIARLDYVLDTYDSLIEAGYSEAYKNMINGHNRSAKTVLYEKEIGDNSYYIVQAVPHTKAKKIVCCFCIYWRKRI